MTTQRYDIAVVGGGLHGVSIAAEAASRGLSVVLFQAKDLASGPTGSLCTVARGGLRRLERFRLDWVNRNLREIALLKSRAPHLLTRQLFQVVSRPSVRSDRRIRRGLAIYSFLQNRQFRSVEHDRPVKTNTAQLEYNEFRLCNNRLILNLARQAKYFGADIRPYCRVDEIHRQSDHWQLTNGCEQTDSKSSVEAKILVNCCGWLAEKFLRDVVKAPTRCRAKVCHSGRFYFPRPEHFRNYVFQQDNGALVYAHELDQHYFVVGPINFENDNDEQRTLALNTALDFLKSVGISYTAEDCRHAAWSSRALPEDLLSNDGQRYKDYYLDLHNPGKVAPLLNLFGMSTVHYRLIAEHALEILKVFTEADKNTQYSDAPLLGADFSKAFDLHCAEIKSDLTPEYHELAQRWLESYGKDSDILISALKSNTLGEHIAHGLYEAEVKYLVENEWVTCADDILWRRSALGLHFNEGDRDKLSTTISTLT